MRGPVRGTRILLLLLTLTTAGSSMAARPQPAALPQTTVEVPATAQAATRHVRKGDDLQQALDAAQPGDVIELEAGAEFHGSFVLPRKTGAGWIEIRSSALAQLPDGRIDPSHAASMPTLVANGDSVIVTAPGAHHYRFTGIELRPARGKFIYNLVQLGDGSENKGELPHHIVFDRCYLHGDSTAGTRRGIALNGSDIAVVDSWLADFKEVGADSQALSGWNGPGPIRIENNHIEAAGENLMFGGETPAIAGLVPADIEIRGNHFHKNLAWKESDPAYAGTPWAIKNLLELKNARRVLIEGNVFENNWAAAQNGFAIVLTVRNEGGAVPWAALEDVTFRNNVLTRIAGGFNVLGHDDNGHPSGHVSRITISNNLFENMGGDFGAAALLQLLDGVSDLTIEGNSADNTAAIIVSEGRPHTQVSFSGNRVVDNEPGIVGSGTAAGTQTLERFFPDVRLERNAFVGGQASDYPGANFFPATMEYTSLDSRLRGNDEGAGVDGEGAGADGEGARGDSARIDGEGARADGDEASAIGVDVVRLCAALSVQERQRHCGTTATSRR